VFSLKRLYEKTVPTPPSDYVRLDYVTLKQFVADVFKALGVPSEDAEVAADVLVAADLMGVDSHGVQRLKRYTGGIRMGSVNPRAEVRVVKEGEATALIDGNAGLGQVVAFKAMRLAIEKARKVGVAAVGVRNSNHFGMAGYFVLQAIKENMIGGVLTNSEALVAYTHTLGRSFGTNPVAIGAPARYPPPIIFDAAVGVVPIGKVEIYAKEGKKLPLGWVIGPDGKLLEDPKEALEKKAAVLPLGGLGEEMGGHKGAALALIVDLLSGILTGASWGKGVRHTLSDTPANVGHFIIALDIESFMPLEQFLDRVEQLKSYVKSLPKISEDSEVWIPGEKAWLTMETRKHIGIPVHRNVLKELIDEGEKAGVKFNVKMLKETA